MTPSGRRAGPVNAQHTNATDDIRRLSRILNGHGAKVEHEWLATGAYPTLLRYCATYALRSSKSCCAVLRFRSRPPPSVYCEVQVDPARIALRTCGSHPHHALGAPFEPTISAQDRAPITTLHIRAITDLGTVLCLWIAYLRSILPGRGGVANSDEVDRSPKSRYVRRRVFRYDLPRRVVKRGAPRHRMLPVSARLAGLSPHADCPLRLPDRAPPPKPACCLLPDALSMYSTSAGYWERNGSDPIMDPGYRLSNSSTRKQTSMHSTDLYSSAVTPVTPPTAPSRPSLPPARSLHKPFLLPFTYIGRKQMEVLG